MVLILRRTKIDEINQRKEEELKAMNIRVQKLQTDLMAANQVRPHCTSPLLCTFPQLFYDTFDPVRVISYNRNNHVGIIYVHR